MVCMKHWISTLATALLALAFSSCLNLDDGTRYVREFGLMGTVTSGGVNPVFQMEEGFSVTTTNAVPADTFEVGERYFLHFILGDTINHAANLYPIKLYRFAKTNLKPFVVLEEDSTDVWKNQPVGMQGLWYSGQYCNIVFSTFMGVGTPNTIELVRMKGDETTTPTDTAPKLYFELRHNVANYSAYYSSTKFYSFDLSSLETGFPNAVKYSITVKWNEEGHGTSSYNQWYVPNKLIPVSEVFSKEKNTIDLESSF